MLYELIYNAPRVVDAIARDYSDREPVRVEFEFISDPDPDRDPLGDDTRIGTRLRDGFALLGSE